MVMMQLWHFSWATAFNYVRSTYQFFRIFFLKIYSATEVRRPIPISVPLKQLDHVSLSIKASSYRCSIKANIKHIFETNILALPGQTGVYHLLLSSFQPQTAMGRLRKPGNGFLNITMKSNQKARV